MKKTGRAWSGSEIRAVIGAIFMAVLLLLVLKFMLVSLPFLLGLFCVSLFIFGTGFYAAKLDRKIDSMSDRNPSDVICRSDLLKSRFFKTTAITIWILGCLYVVIELIRLFYFAFTDSWKFGVLAILHVITGPFLLFVIAFPIHWIGELYRTRATKIVPKR